MNNYHTLNWAEHQQRLSETGFTLLPPLLSADECRELANLFDAPEHFRKTIVMQKHGYGRGEYKYFNYPLPPAVAALRHELFRQLVPVANDWNEKLGISQRYPDTLEEWLTTCHEAGQNRPTPLMLQYGAGDWNALHQDMYGELYFPFQAVLMLCQPGQDFIGGRVRPDGAAAPDAVAGYCAATQPGTGAGIHHEVQARKRNAGILPHRAETRGKRSKKWSTDDAGANFS